MATSKRLSTPEDIEPNHGSAYNAKLASCDADSDCIIVSDPETSDHSYETVTDPGSYEVDEDKDRSLFNWNLIVTKAYANKRKSQVFHIPQKTADSVLVGKKDLYLHSQHKMSGIRCTIKSYKRYTNEKKKKIVVTKFLTTGWYEWALANNLVEGDELIFELTDPPDILYVDIVRSNNNAT